jgi:XTP/dITP diphosphohydrolase
MQLLIATRNAHKFREITAILGLPDLKLLDLAIFPDMPAVEEDGDTFEANAAKKAASLATASGLWTLADDSGLEVDRLGGEPGVRSARYAGEPSNDAANNRKLLRMLEGAGDRKARFRCAVALASPAGTTQAVEGRCEGRLLAVPRGSGGFGYDPLFVPDGYEQTFAELEPAIKNRISHRAQALRLALAKWGAILASGPADWPDSAAV